MEISVHEYYNYIALRNQAPNTHPPQSLINIVTGKRKYVSSLRSNDQNSSDTFSGQQASAVDGSGCKRTPHSMG